VRTQPSLFEDRDLDGGPGLHALVIGISRYPHLPPQGGPPRGEQFGLCSVDGPALTAWRVAEKLRTLPAGAAWVRPLKSLRLLLLPSNADCAAEPALAQWNGQVPDVITARQVAAAWQADCEASDNEVALFYFAGHGLRLDVDCLVLAGFGENASAANPSLVGCCSVESLMQGMFARRGWEMAREQFWFVDACRTPIDYERIGEVIPPERLLSRRFGDGQNLRQFGLQATAVGGAALTWPGQTGTAFGNSFLNALDGAVDRPLATPAGAVATSRPWPVNVLTLQSAIHVQLGANPVTASQKTDLLGAGGTGPLLLHSQPPEITVRFAVGPPPYRPTMLGKLRLQRLGGPPDCHRSFSQLVPHPYEDKLPAGNYEVEWDAAGQRQVDSWFASLASADLLL
jgi:hypothetical protein